MFCIGGQGQEADEKHQKSHGAIEQSEGIVDVLEDLKKHVSPSVLFFCKASRRAPRLESGGWDLVHGRAKNMPIPVNPVCPAQLFVILMENTFQWPACRHMRNCTLWRALYISMDLISHPWSSWAIAHGTLLYARVERHPGQTFAHSSIPASHRRQDGCRGNPGKGRRAFRNAIDKRLSLVLVSSQIAETLLF
jgi:hypothetical protein